MTKAKNESKTASELEREKDEQAKKGLLALAVLVVALGVLVWWASSSGKDSASENEAGASESAAHAGEVAVAKADGAVHSMTTLERLPESGGDLTILTDKGDDAIAAITNVDALGKALDVPYCGPACDAVKKLAADKEHFEIETQTGADIILPPKDTLDTIAPSLTPKERESVHTRRAAIVVHARSEVSRDQIAARALFGVTALLAEKLDGLVWDETTRRVESAAQAKKRAITVPLGANVFSPPAIVVQFYRQEDATARLVTLGMSRFGAADLSLRGSSMAAGAMLVDVVNALASSIVAGADKLPLTVAPLDAKGKEPVTFDVGDAPRVQGDPDDFVELVPSSGGATRESWDAVVEKLFGEGARSIERRVDQDLEAAGARARKELPAAIKRFENGEGQLFVWGPFPIPEDDRADGGPDDEWLWVKVASCDDKACTGALSNRPMFATNIASGKTTSLSRARIADWQLRFADGGIAGGETVKRLEPKAD